MYGTENLYSCSVTPERFTEPKHSNRKSSRTLKRISNLRVCFIPPTPLTVKIINDARPGINVNVRSSGEALYPDLQSVRRPLLVVGLRIIYKDGPCLPSNPPALSPPPAHPPYPTLQSPQIRFNQTTCAVWLGVRKRIISKQSSYSPGFIGIRTGLLCRI